MNPAHRSWLACVLALVCLTTAQAAVRVALIGSGLSESGEAALGLSEATLTGQTDLELLDRSTIGKILREHNLLADGFAQSEDAVQLGQLLAVDVFIHVETIPEKTVLAVTAFETAQGIRLVDEVVAGDNASELSEGLAADVDKALAKWRAPVGQATAIALMGVRNVDLPKSRNGECDALGVLLERRLLSSPDVVVVERKRLQSLNVDRDVAPNRPKERLLSAPVLVELDVEQAGSAGGLRAAAHLSSAKGAMLGVVRAGASTSPELADKLRDKILEKLQAGASSPSASPQLESARFFRQARFWKAQERFDLMLASAEAAYALDSTNPVMRMLLINALFSAANAELAAARPVALAYAARGMGMLRQPSPPPAFSNPEQKKQFTQIAADVENFFRGFGERVGQSRGGHPLSEEEAANYADFCRDWLAQSPYAPDTELAPSVWDLLLFVAEPDVFEYFPDSESAWRTLTGLVKRWCAERLGKERSAIPPWTLLGRLMVVEDGLGVASDYRARADLWAFMEQREEPLLKWFGRCGRIFDEARRNQDPERLATPESRALLADLAVAIRQPAPEVPPDALCEIAWLAIRRNGGDIGPIDERARRLIGQQLPEMADWMQAQLAAGFLHEHNLQSLKILMESADRTDMKDLRIETLRRLEMAVAGTSPVAVASVPQRQALAAFLVWLREQIEPGSTALPPAKNVRVESIGSGDSRKYWVGHAALLQDETGVYVFSAYCAPPRLLLQKWKLGDKTLLDIGMAEFSPPCPFGGASSDSRAWVQGVDDVCLGPHFIAAAVRQKGVILFDRESAAVETLHEKTALPVEHPSSVGALGEILYVGTDDGYLVAYDTVGQTGSVLVASSRKEKKSPFDDGPPVRITAIFPDPPRQRIVFLASVVEAESDLGMALSPQGGIWEFRADIGRFRQLVSYRHRADDVTWCEMVAKDAFAVRALWGGVFLFDLATDRIDVLSQDGQKNMYKSVVDLLAATGLDQVLPGVVPVAQRTSTLGPPYLLRGDGLWISNPAGRFSTKTYQFEKWPPFRMPDGSIRELRPDMGMIPASDTQTLFATMHELWLVTMMDGEPGREEQDGLEDH